jgi:DNA-binding transcriptional MerR regulator
MEIYKIHKVVKMLDVPAYQLRYWDRISLVEPSMKERTPRGSRRIYSEGDLAALGTVRQLRKKGISLQKIRKAVSRLRAKTPDKNVLAECSFVAVGRNVFVPEVDTWFREQMELPIATERRAS